MAGRRHTPSGGAVGDHDDPRNLGTQVLWALVRGEEPAAPGLPRLRYRLPLPAGSQDKVAAAIRQYLAPQLWWGEEQREAGHLGRPDVSSRPRS